MARLRGFVAAEAQKLGGQVGLPHTDMRDGVRQGHGRCVDHRGTTYPRRGRPELDKVVEPAAPAVQVVSADTDAFRRNTSFYVTDFSVRAPLCRKTHRMGGLTWHLALNRTGCDQGVER